MTESSNDTTLMETFYSDLFIEETKVKNKLNRTVVPASLYIICTSFTLPLNTIFTEQLYWVAANKHGELN